MASVRCFVKSKSKSSSIYIRLTVDRNLKPEKKTGYSTDSNDWSKVKGKTKTNDETQKSLNNSLLELERFILSEYNGALSRKISIDSAWLETTIKKHHGTLKKDSELIIDWFSNYIASFPFKKKQGSDKVGVKESTIKKYENISGKLSRFQVSQRKSLKVRDINQDFQENFIKYLHDVEGYSLNTIGRDLKFLKTVCLYAKKKGVQISPELVDITGFTEEPIKMILSFDELEKIKNTRINKDYLDNARDWLILGCHLGQRVSDLLNLTTDNVQVFGEVKIVTIVQKKTRKQVAIPLNEEIDLILNKRKGEFPRKISDQKFNDYIKEVAKLSGLSEIVDGAKSIKTKDKDKDKEGDKDTYRKIKGKYPKHELITSHICRRSYATNYYGEIPTSLLISVTGHATEQQFLEYVGKAPIDQAMQLAKMYAELSYIRKTENLKVEYKKVN